jgi:hypothetical protein
MNVLIGVQSVPTQIGLPEGMLADRFLEVRVLNKYGEDLWTYRPSWWDPDNSSVIVEPAIRYCRQQRWTPTVDRQQLLDAIHQQCIYAMHTEG